MNGKSPRMGVAAHRLHNTHFPVLKHEPPQKDNPFL